MEYRQQSCLNLDLVKKKLLGHTIALVMDRCTSIQIYTLSIHFRGNELKLLNIKPIWLLLTSLQLQSWKISKVGLFWEWIPSTKVLLTRILLIEANQDFLKRYFTSFLLNMNIEYLLFQNFLLNQIKWL